MNILKRSRLVFGCIELPIVVLALIIVGLAATSISIIECDQTFSTRSSLPVEVESSFIQTILNHLKPYSERFSLSSILNFNGSPKRSATLPLVSSDPLECGQRFKTINGRIVGGHVSSVADFPWMVSLQREKNGWFGSKAFYHSCGGSLITKSWILTAAHCLYNRDEPLRAIAGTDNLNFLYRSQTRSIKRQIVHPGFDLTTYNNDIALIKTNQPFNLASTFSRIGVVCLEPNLQVQSYDIATICGFGSRAFHERTRTHLYKTDIAIIDEKQCNRSFGGMITNNMICAGGMIANKRDACSGDSGGPLMMEVPDDSDDSNEHITLIGVVSFGNDCAMQNYPGIYTKVSNYYDWIVKQIDEPLIEPRTNDDDWDE